MNWDSFQEKWGRPCLENREFAHWEGCICGSRDLRGQGIQGINLGPLKDSLPEHTETALTYKGSGIISASYFLYVNHWMFIVGLHASHDQGKKIISKIYLGRKMVSSKLYQNVWIVLSLGVRVWPLFICWCILFGIKINVYSEQCLFCKKKTNVWKPSCIPGKDSPWQSGPPRAQAEPLWAILPLVGPPRGTSKTLFPSVFKPQFCKSATHWNSRRTWWKDKTPQIVFCCSENSLMLETLTPWGAVWDHSRRDMSPDTCLLSLQVGLPWLLQPVSGAGQEERARQHRQEGHLQVRPGEPHQGELAHPGRPGLWERLDQNALSLGQGGVNCPFWSSSLLKLSEMLIRSPTSMTVKEKPLHVSRVPPSLFHISVHIENEIICTAHWGLGWGPSWLQAAGPRSPASP